jgi:cytochrome c oxidase subunit 2
MSRALFTDKEKKDVSAWVANLEPVRAAATVDGDAAKGQALYTPCIACHGPAGQGNQALSSPAITHLNDWYLVSSIHKFKDGLRGADASKDPTGAMMRTMAMTLASDEAVRDVVAYIRTLGN